MKKLLLYGIGGFIAFTILLVIIGSFLPDEVEEATTTEATTEQQEKILETRRISTETMAKTGPGDEYENDASGEFYSSNKILVYEEKGDWIRVKVVETDPNSYWVKKEHTVTEMDWANIKNKEAKSTIEKNIKLFTENNLLTRYDIEGNKVYVNPLMWNSIDLQIKETFCQTMSQYFDMERGFKRVEVLDTRNGKRLARYNPDTGLKID